MAKKANTTTNKSTNGFTATERKALLSGKSIKRTAKNGSEYVIYVIGDEFWETYEKGSSKELKAHGKAMHLNRDLGVWLMYDFGDDVDLSKSKKTAPRKASSKPSKKEALKKAVMGESDICPLPSNDGIDWNAMSKLLGFDVETLKAIKLLNEKGLKVSLN